MSSPQYCDCEPHRYSWGHRAIKLASAITPGLKFSRLEFRVFQQNRPRVGGPAWHWLLSTWHWRDTADVCQRLASLAAASIGGLTNTSAPRRGMTHRKKRIECPAHAIVRPHLADPAGLNPMTLRVVPSSEPSNQKPDFPRRPWENPCGRT